MCRTWFGETGETKQMNAKSKAEQRAVEMNQIHYVCQLGGQTNIPILAQSIAEDKFLS